MNTEKLFLDNPYEETFLSRVLSQDKTRRGYEVVLERTAFYPEGGGQPNDTGWLDGIPVINVIEEDGRIIHIMEKPVSAEKVTGKVNWERRFDHMQQHLGQHILSSCFEKIADANTVGFHLGSQYVYIDLDRQDLTEEIIYRAEDMANGVVFQGLGVKTYFVNDEALSGLPLRKPPTVTGNIRIVEIDGFDFCPCCGTHPVNTGSVGIIKVRRWERNKDCTRLEFICGKRALEDFRYKNTSINRISSLLSVRDSEVLGSVERITGDNKRLARELENLKEQYCSLEAEVMVNKAEKIGLFKVIRFMYYKRPFDEIKLLASKITGNNGCIAILCTSDERSQLVVSRSPDIRIDLRPSFKEAMAPVGGKGGGNSSVVQGGVDSTEKAQQVMDKILFRLSEEIGALQ